MGNGHNLNCQCMACKRINNVSMLCRDPNWLTLQYWGNNLSLQSIAKLANTSSVTIRYWMLKYNIPIKKSNSQYFKNRTINQNGHKYECQCPFCQLRRGDTSWLSDEIRLKRNKSIKKGLNSLQGKQNLSNGQSRRYENPLEKKKQSKKTKEQWRNPEIRKNRIKGLKKSGSKSEFKIKMANISKQRWQDPVYKDRVVRATASSNGKNYSQLEFYMKEILNKLYSNEWIHNKSPIKIIGGKIPDFVHVHKQIVIEVNGDYWHSKVVTGVDKNIHEQQQIDHYKKYGHDCVVFWECEINGLNFEQLLIERLSNLYLKVENNKKEVILSGELE